LTSTKAESAPERGQNAERGSDARQKFETILSTLAGFGVFGLALITGPMLGRALDEDGRGSLAAVVVSTQIISWAIMFGLPQATAYYATKHRRTALINTTWWFAALVGVPVIAVIAYVGPGLLERGGHPPLVTQWFRLYLVLGLLVLPYTTAYDWLRGRMENGRFNLWRSLPVVLTTAFIFGLFVAGRLTLTSALAATALGNVIGWLTTIYVERALPTARPDIGVAREQLHYGSRIWVGTLSNLVVARFDQFLMIPLIDAGQLGLYVVASTAAQASSPLSQGVALAVFPYLREDADDGAASWARTRKVLIWTGALSVAIGLGMAAVAPFAIPWLFGGFRGAIVPLLILLPGQVFWNLGNVASSKLEADDRPGASSWALAVAAVITVIAVPFVVPTYGIRGAAVVTTIAQFAFMAWAIIAARRDVPGTSVRK